MYKNRDPFYELPTIPVSKKHRVGYGGGDRQTRHNSPFDIAGLEKCATKVFDGLFQARPILQPGSGTR